MTLSPGFAFADDAVAFAADAAAAFCTTEVVSGWAENWSQERRTAPQPTRGSSTKSISASRRTMERSSARSERI